MFGPLSKTLEMENVHALRLTCCSGILLYNLHLAYSTHIFRFIFAILLFLLLDYSRQLLAGTFQKIRYSICVNNATC